MIALILGVWILSEQGHNVALFSRGVDIKWQGHNDRPVFQGCRLGTVTMISLIPGVWTVEFI
jgi:hypothetical protein